MKYYGVDYYPEQWGMDLVDEDLDNIVELGANLIRIADFAWDRFEPEEGKYDFSFFDEVIQKAKKRKLSILMCVPTATMPAWLYEKYPEIMNENEYGYRQPYGARRGYCVNSDIYLEKAQALTKALASHYKDEVAIVGWQIDNEIGHEGSDMCYCENCHQKFITWLENKYADISDLNQRWGTSFWSQTYSHFKQIPLPKPAFTAQNPTLRLEYLRFRAKAIENYIATLADTLRAYDPNHPVTHDFYGGTIDKCFNPFEISKHLDFVCYNNYPVWGGQKAPKSDSDIAFSIDFARGFKQEKFWITESIMGAQGHNDIGCAPKPLEAKKWALDSLDHGVESLIFFRYRGFTKGAEQYCFGILDADNQKRRKYYETQDFFKEAKDREVEYPKSQACIIYDFDSKSSMKIQRQSNVYSYEQQCQKLYNQFYRRHLNCDIIDSSCDFANYKIVILPTMIIMSEEFKQQLKAYVAQGGIVVMTARTGWKDTDNNLIFGSRLPAGLTDLTGCMIEEQEALLDDQYQECEFNGLSGKGNVFWEGLTLTSASPLVHWTNSPFGDYAGATVNHYGQGYCYYLGSSFDENILTSLFDLILK